MDSLYLLLLSIPFIIFPWLAGRHAPENFNNLEREETNNRLYESQCRYFANQFQIGAISERQFSDLILDARRILLNQTEDVVVTHRHNNSLRIVPLVIVALFTSVYFMYSYLGSEKDQRIFNILSRYSIGDETDITNGDDIDVLVSLIKERVKERPRNIHYWLLLAKFAQRNLEYRDAVDYYASALALDSNNSYILADYAEVLFLADGSLLTDRVIEAIQAAFISDPESSRVLGLKGIEAFSEKRFLDAIRFWQQAKVGLDDNSEDVIAMQKGIERATIALSVPVESHSTEGSRDDGPFGFKERQAKNASTIDFSLGNIFVRSSSDEVFLLVFEAGASDVPLMAKSVRLTSLPANVVFSNIDLLDPSQLASDLRHLEVVARMYGQGRGSLTEKKLDLRSRSIDLVNEPLPLIVTINQQSRD